MTRQFSNTVRRLTVLGACTILMLAAPSAVATFDVELANGDVYGGSEVHPSAAGSQAAWAGTEAQLPTALAASCAVPATWPRACGVSAGAGPAGNLGAAGASCISQARTYVSVSPSVASSSCTAGAGAGDASGRNAAAGASCSPEAVVTGAPHAAPSPECRVFLQEIATVEYVALEANGATVTPVVGDRQLTATACASVHTERSTDPYYAYCPGASPTVQSGCRYGNTTGETGPRLGARACENVFTQNGQMVEACPSLGQCAAIEAYRAGYAQDDRCVLVNYTQGRFADEDIVAFCFDD